MSDHQNQNEAACGGSALTAVLDRAAKLRADLDYVQAYLESAYADECEWGRLMSAGNLLGDVREFLARDDNERTNA